MHRIQVMRHLHDTEPAVERRWRAVRRYAVLLLTLVALGMCSLSGCALLPNGFSGAWKPTPHTFRLTEDDLVAANDQGCAQLWATGEGDKDLAEAERRIQEAGYRVKVRRVSMTSFARTLRRSITVPPEFEQRTDGEKARWLAHELVHVCQRKQMGHGAFEASLAHSAGRWRLETAGYATTVFWRARQGQAPDSLARWMAAKLDSFRNDYALHDIDPHQYEQATLSVWNRARLEAAAG